MSEIDKAGYEKSWANHAIRLKQADEEKALWSRSRYTVRPYVYFDKILIAWSVVKGEPQTDDVLTVTGMDASFTDGLWINFQSKLSGHADFVITHVPRLLPGLDIFAWVPFFNELRFASEDWDDPLAPKNLRLSACFKMRSRPDESLIEGHHYLSELHVFREKFPKFRSVRF